MQKSPKYVVVIGAARSGTKFVRQLIGSSASCRVVPYDVNFVWRTGNLSKAHDALAASECNEKTARQIQRKLQKLSNWRSGDDAPFIVEKTVSNCLRVPFIERALDDVQYIHLIRDGRDVVESSFRQWNEPPQLRYLLRKFRSLPLSDVGYAVWYAKNVARGILSRGKGVGVWGVRYPGVEQDVQAQSLLEVCARQWETCVSNALADLQQVPAERCLSIRYEDLVRDDQQVDRICDYLKLSDRQDVRDFYQQSVSANAQSWWQKMAENPDWQAAMTIMRPQLESLGYLQAKWERELRAA